MSQENIVIVESPAKAKTINKYLGADYYVTASFGHVRDLPPKDGSVDPDNDFSMKWQVQAQGKKHLDDIAKICKSAKNLYLATDPDREGEAISWHVWEELNRKGALKNIQHINRVVFHEITKKAVLDAMQSPRQLDQPLIDAYLARRALDYLVGFNLSPVLWRKLPGAKSAGRVQSVALKLICEREDEIKAFQSREYWSVIADCLTIDNKEFSAQLDKLDGKKIQKFDIATKELADNAALRVKEATLFIQDVEKKQQRRNPFPPFTTSTLQQEASRKLGFSATHTMRVAQKLYEGINIGGETTGLITYMRTDSTSIANDALIEVRSVIDRIFGVDYLPEKANFYKTTAKNAQEAHEAVRPTSFARQPKEMAAFLDKDQLKLYGLIWNRATASQMRPAILDIVGVNIASDKGDLILRATGSTVNFPGFLALYTEDVDDSEQNDDDNKKLPPMNKGDRIVAKECNGNQHFTQPPPRYSEASLVKRMEELGIGRPSTYASILRVLQDRDYVKLEKRRFIPEDRGQLVTAFLKSFFQQYVDYDFTAKLEDQLDDISTGQSNWRDILSAFWQDFYKNTTEALDLQISDVREALDAILSPYFFSKDADGSDEKSRRCPRCDGGRLSLNFGKFGAYASCSNYPDCKFTRQFNKGNSDADADGAEGDDANIYPMQLGVHPDTQKEIFLKKGPYGFYVQMGEGKKDEVKRSALPKGMTPGDVTFEKALKLLSLPRLLGQHPDSKEDVIASIGPYGPYLKVGSRYVSIGEGDDVLEIGINRAVEVIATAPEKGKAGGQGKIKDIGTHPDGGVIAVYKGRYGPYVKWGKINATIPKDTAPENIEQDEALALIEKKIANPSVKKRRPKKAKK